MKKRTIWVIIILMTIALLGLVSFQLYWINSAIELSKEQFQKDVYESLNVVVDRLERKEIMEITTKSLPHTKESHFAFNFDRHVTVENEIGDSTYIFVSGDSVHKALKVQDDKADHVKVIYQLHRGSNEEGETGITKNYEKKRKATFTDTLTNHRQSVSIINTRRKSVVIEKVIEEMKNSHFNGNKKIRLKVIDSLLHQEFTNKGIDIDYTFAVWNPKKDTLLVSDKSLKKEDFNSTTYKANLFPNDLFGNINYLMINFPKERQYMFGKVWVTLMSSILMIFIIACCFSYSVHIILKQKKLSAVKNDFINNMTHEFKTPIATVLLTCEALLEEEVRNNAQTYERYVGVIKEENRKLEQQVEKVLQSANLERGENSLNFETLDLHSLIEKVASSFSLRLRQAGGKVVLQLHASKYRIYGDNIHISNAINNLLDNAIKYTDQPPEVLITSKNINGGMQIIITDNGIGISKENQKKVFDKFYRVPKGNLHDVKGFGLGLGYVKSIIENHGGKVDLTSTLQKGSSFVIFLPLPNV